MLFRQFGPAEIIIIVVLLILLFGWKRLPDAARSLGRSARVFKSEVDEMKRESKAGKEASEQTIPGETVPDKSTSTQTDAPRASDRVGQEDTRAPGEQSGPIS